MNKNDYVRLVRIATVVASVLVWYLSIVFSAKGFNFEIGSGFEWSAIGLGLVVTVFELAGNRAGVEGNKNLTLFIIWIACYGYGIYTNVVGIMNVRVDAPGNLPFAIVLGFFLEVAPEVFFVWALTEELETGDFFSNVFGNFQNFGGKQSYPQQNQGKQNKQRNYDPQVEQRRNEFHQKRKGGGNQNFSGVPFQLSGEDDIERFLRNIDQRENGN